MFSREDFHYDVADACTCPAGKTLSTSGTIVTAPRSST